MSGAESPPLAARRAMWRGRSSVLNTPYGHPGTVEGRRKDIVKHHTGRKQNEPGHARLEIESDCCSLGLNLYAAAESPR